MYRERELWIFIFEGWDFMIMAIDMFIGRWENMIAWSNYYYFRVSSKYLLFSIDVTNSVTDF